jgi:hypothetical protein
MRNESISAADSSDRQRSSTAPDSLAANPPSNADTAPAAPILLLFTAPQSPHDAAPAAAIVLSSHDRD